MSALKEATLEFAVALKNAGCEKLPPALRAQCEKKQKGGDKSKDDDEKSESKGDDKKDDKGKGEKKLPPWLKKDKKAGEIAERVALRYAAAKFTKPVHVKIEGWGGTRKIPKKELQDFGKALKNAPELKGSGLGFGVLMSGGPTVQINPKFLDKLEKVVKAQGKRMGNPKPGVGIVGIEV